MRVLHLNKSGSGLASKTACGRSAVNTPMSANWTEYKAAPVAHRCARCEASKQAELNRKRDAEQEAAPVVLEEVETIIAQPVADDDVVAVASYANGAHIGLSINGQFVLSFPAQLVAGAIPSVDEAEWILTGAEVRTACDRFNLAGVAAHNAACRAVYEAQRYAGPKVSLEKAPAPVGVCILADVPQESNAIVFARAIAVVRMRRLTAEYLAAHDGEPAALDAGTWDIEAMFAGQTHTLPTQNGMRAYAAGKRASFDNPYTFPSSSWYGWEQGFALARGRAMRIEQERALAAEQARADAARKLAGVPLYQLGKGF